MTGRTTDNQGVITTNRWIEHRVSWIHISKEADLSHQQSTTGEQVIVSTSRERQASDGTQVSEEIGSIVTTEIQPVDRCASTVGENIVISATAEGQIDGGPQIDEEVSTIIPTEIQPVDRSAQLVIENVVIGPTVKDKITFQQTPIRKDVRAVVATEIQVSDRAYVNKNVVVRPAAERDAIDGSKVD